LLNPDDEPSVWRPGLAVLLAEVGMLEEARRELDAMSPGGFAAIARDSVWPACVTFLAEACIACRAVEHADTLLQELDRFAGQTLMVAMSACFGPADRLRGAVCRILGRHDEARGHFVAALELCDRSGSPVWRARTLADWAEMALEAGERTHAIVLATEAVELASSLGMASVEERARRSIVGAQAMMEPVSVVPAPSGLSGREVDVLRLIASGLSNREIGDRLFISQHTAANHVRSILQKCGCANRAEAAAYAARHGLLEPV
jgi:DNA-binding CsgD family transcriptional regulator